MANSNFVVHNGLTVGPLSIDAATGSITTTGNISANGTGPQSFSGNIVAASATTSTSKTTGAIVISGSGGVGIGGNVNANAFYSDYYLYSNGITITTPAGANTMVQFNDGSNFAGATYLQYNKTSGNLVSNSTTASTSITTGALVLNGGLGVSGQATIANVTSISGTNIAYLTADSNYVHIGSASNTQLNFKINSQTPAFIAANGSVIITGNTSLQSGGGGNLFVRNNTGSAVGQAITDATSFHVGTVTNSQFNLKQNNTTQAYIDTSGNVNVVNSLIVAGNLKVTGSITTTGSNNIVTDNQNLVLANNQTTTAGVDGAGILLGNNSVVVWTYQNATNAWRSNVNILPTTNNTLNLGGPSNYFNTIYVGNVYSSGPVTATTGTFSGAVSPSSNASVNLGSTSAYWNNVYAVNFLGTSTTAKYADLAERYTSDVDYEPGTVVDFGGTAEVTLSNINGSQYVAGVVSTNPAYLMNGGLEENFVAVALQGRVPCKVTGPIEKGAMMVSNGDGTARMERNPKMGSVIGKALQSFGDGVGVIEVVVGRL
jgi:hypothetical protein